VLRHQLLDLDAQHAGEALCEAHRAAAGEQPRGDRAERQPDADLAQRVLRGSARDGGDSVADGGSGGAAADDGGRGVLHDRRGGAGDARRERGDAAGDGVRAGAAAAAA
jgi:hypothetical protein